MRGGELADLSIGSQDAEYDEQKLQWVCGGFTESGGGAGESTNT